MRARKAIRPKDEPRPEGILADEDSDANDPKPHRFNKDALAGAILGSRRQ